MPRIFLDKNVNIGSILVKKNIYFFIFGYKCEIFSIDGACSVQLKNKQCQKFFTLKFEILGPFWKKIHLIAHFWVEI